MIRTRPILAAEFVLHPQRQFLPPVPVQLPEERAELYPLQAVVQANVGDPRAQPVVLDVVNQHQRHLRTPLAQGQRLQHAGIAVLVRHASPLEGKRAVGPQTPHRAGRQARLHLDDRPHLVLLAPVLFRRHQPHEHARRHVLL